jgi:hypothetical protein
MKMPSKVQILSLALVGASLFVKLWTGGGRASGAPKQRKLALLVGVNKYRDPHVPTLSGCVNDANNWEDLLTKKFGFAPGDILKLTDEQATKAAVKEAFAKHLVAQATSDTVVVIAVSSHGTQVLDRNGDEADGLDESFVLHDSNFAQDEDPPSQLIDDEINVMLTELNRKTQHIVLIADSCFSGDIAKGRVRFLPLSDRVRQQAAELVAKRGLADDQPDGIKPEEGGPRYVLISAAQSDQTANEKFFAGQVNGALTWYLTSALRKADADATYKDVFDKVRFDVTAAFAGQQPQIEGAEQETALFGLKAVPADAYLAVQSTRGNKLTLGGGQVHGIGVGSKFGIFPPGTRTARGATPLATAEVKSVALTTSEAELPASVSLPGGARAFPTTYMVPIHRTKVFVPKKPALAKIREAIKANPAVELFDQDKDYDLRVAEDTGRQALVLEAGNAGPITDPVPESAPDAAGTMAAKINAWAKWYNVRNLANPVESLDVSFKQIRSEQQGSTGKATSDGDHRRLVKDEEFYVRIENKEDQPLYFNILDLASTGQIALVPLSNAIVKAHGKWEHRYKADLPKGLDYDRDTLKLVVSTQPLDLKFVEQPAAPGAAKGVLSTVADLVGKAAFGGARGIALVDDDANQWATREVVYEVQPEVTVEEQKVIETCYDRLPSLGVSWKKARQRRGVADPVQLSPQVNGITFHNSLGRVAPLYMSCLLAEKLAAFTKAVAILGVTDIHHLGIYNYRCIGGGSPDGHSCKVSEHAFARAIDFASFTTKDKGTVVVEKDWTKRSQSTCKVTGGSEKDQFLRDVACNPGKATFNILLTPNYNAAHRNHFHADATPTKNHSVRGGDVTAEGTDPDDANLGD